MTSLSQYILNSRYLQPNEQTFDDVAKRVSKAISNNSTEEESFYDIMHQKKFVPGGRTLACAGTSRKLIPNCVVLPVEDTLADIFETQKRAALLQQAGCVIPGTRLRTDNGDIIINEHVGKIVNVWNGYQFTEALVKLTGFDEDVFEVKLVDGRSLICTLNHEFLSNVSETIKLSELMVNERKVIYTNIHKNVTTHPEMGFVQIKSIEYKWNSPYVYCVTTLDDSHCAMFNDIVTHNCGLGFNFSKLRPAGYPCVRTGGKSSGPISYINHYSSAFQIVQQFNRSGANIGILSIEHPDIIPFIHMKDDLQKLNNFNISVLMTKRFMDTLREAPDTIWKCKYNDQYVLPRYITYDEKFVIRDISEIEITVQELFDEIVHAAWKSGEPGLLFEDHMNEYNLLESVLGRIDGVNPCGELALYPNECCNLGSINLEEFCTEREDYNEIDLEGVLKYVDTNDLIRTIKIATVFLNNVIDKMDIPDDHLAKFVKTVRRIGLGLMGFADMCIKLKIAYNTQVARELMVYITGLMKEYSHKTSEELCGKYGSVYDRLLIADKEGGILPDGSDVSKCCDILKKMANCNCTCIAPTGSTSMIHNVSTGIEPFFSVAFRRTIMNTGKTEIVINKHLEKYLKDNSIYSDDVLNDIVDNGLASIEYIPDYVKSVYVTAQEMTPDDHIMMQASAQANIDNSISKTCNFTNEATEEDVARIYNLAYELHCKGTTVYRDGSRYSQVLTDSKKKNMPKSLSVDTCASGMCDA